MVAKKKSDVNKTQKILEYVQAHRKAGPSAVAEALGKEGIEVSAQYVSTIKSKHGIGGRRKKKAAGKKSVKTAASKATSAKPVSSNGNPDFQKLMDAKKFADKYGGISAAKKLLDAYSQLK